MADLSPIPPGEVLNEEFLKPLELSAYRLAQATGMAQTRLSQIIHGKRRITPETAVRLGRALGTSAEFWLNLQSFYDLRTLQRHDSPPDDVEVLVKS